MKSPNKRTPERRDHGWERAALHARIAGAGNASGVIAAWLFGIANFPVVVSILLRASAKAIQSDLQLRDTLRRMNLRQKKFLMKLHYWLNPIAAGAAIFHFSHSECKSTFFPELGLGAMLVIILLGLLMIFRLSPAAARKPISQFHTSPILLAVVISILLIGHSMVD